MIDIMTPLRITCAEPEGTVIRTVQFTPFSFDKLKEYWDKLKDFDVLFGDAVQSEEDFINAFVDTAGSEPMLKGLIWEVDDVGLVYVTDILIGYELKLHASFWDKRLRGREEIIRQLCKVLIILFGVHRIVMEVPLYAPPAIKAVERAGFIKEGRKREAAKYKNDWLDMNIYSALSHEVMKWD